jgi:hypothetical protein
MEKRAIIITTILLILSIGNYLRIISQTNIRSVEFISIFAIGVLTGILITQIVIIVRSKK